MDFSFVIPSTNAELLNSRGDKYYVKQVFDSHEIPDKLSPCISEATSGDPFYIFDHFDTYFSIIENSKNISQSYLFRTYDLLYITVDNLGQKLATVLSKSDGLVGKHRSSYLNLTKMSIYLIIGVVKCIDIIVQQSQAAQLKKVKKPNYGFEQFDWDEKRVKFLIQLYNIFQLPLEKLWDPPVAEDDFVNLVCDINYRTLEIYPNKERQIHTVFQILGTAVKRFNHAMTFPVRILQILRTCEEASMPIANGILLLHEEFGITSVFSILIKDIVDSLSVDSADTQISKHFSTFLTELGTVAPKLIIPHLSTLGDELLNCDSHVLRNCVLQLMGDVITCELTSEELSDDLKEIRDEFLENLLIHINDVSAHVRSKVLQIWNHIKEENAVPLAFQHKVLSCGVERLEDKTSTVRKSAVILIKSFLERNPFAAKLTLAELDKRYETELEKLEKIKDSLAEENNKIADCEKNWDEIIPTLLPIIEEVLSKSSSDVSSSQENYEDMVKRISSLLIVKKYHEAVILAKQADHIAGNSEWLALKIEEQCAYYLALLKSYVLLNSGINSKINDEFETQFQAVKFLEDSIKFSKTITATVPKIQEMLLSKTNSDVFEAVDFFTTGYLFGIKGTEGGMRRMLYLVWSSDKEKRDAVSNAYKKVLFTTDQSGRTHSIKVVKNLCSLFDDLTYGHYTAMEELIKEWVDNKDIDLNIIQVLFERFTLKLEGTTENESRQALQLLILVSNANSTITTANISIIETIGFGERAMKDPRIYTGCLKFLLNSIPIESRSKYYKRYEEDHILIQKCLECFKKYFFHPRVEDFDEITMKTIEFCYTLCQAPDVICQKLIIDIHNKIKSFIDKVQGIQIVEKELPQSQLFTQEDDNIQDINSQIPASQQQQSSQITKINLPIFLITRFIFLVGFTTMKEMIFLDIDVYNNLKYRQELKEQKSNLKKKKNNARNNNNNNNKRKTINLDISASESLKRLSGTAAEPQQEPDEELVGATAEDSIAELINHICENDLLYSNKGILHKMIPIVIDICKNPGKYNNDELQQASSLSLLRFMAISSKFCETNMPFVMNILTKTKNIKIKCNVVVGLSDLTFRFPNVIEPWTGHFYSTLHETNDELRLTAVKMLSHLILHEMIRVKGQIADLAMCIVDENDEIKNITQQFFKEIANKSNILYNVLPDIISKLSDSNLKLEEEKYHCIMRYILGLIQKDRQVESLVEKLCLRFRVTNEERQWRDIAYCLSLLNYTEKTIKKLTDHIQHFKDKVQVDEVYQSFKSIISNTSKLAKVEVKQAITEFEARLQECLEVRSVDILSGGENIENGTTRQQTKKIANKKKQQQISRKGTGRGGRQRQNQQESSSESESSISSSTESESGISKTTDNRPKEKYKKNKSTKPTNNKNSKTPHTRVIVESTSSDEDIPERKRGRNRK